MISNNKTDIFFKVTVPLFNFKNNFKGLVGSGVLFKTNGKVFLITSSHLIKDWGEYLFIPTERGKKFRPAGILSYVSFNYITPGSAKDSIDIAIIELQNPEELIPFYQVTDFSMFLMETKKDEKYQYAITGFPVNKVKVDVNSKLVIPHPVIYYTKEFNDSAYDGIHYWKESHIAVEFTKDTINSVTHERLSAPNFNGVSGGGLWVIKVTDEPNNESYKIYGINIEADIGKSVFYATRVNVIFNQIKEKYNFESL